MTGSSRACLLIDESVPKKRKGATVENAMQTDRIRVGIVQMAPVWLDRAGTLEKVAEFVNRAGKEGCRLLVFGEALVPGYPFWLEQTVPGSSRSCKRSFTPIT